MTKTEKLIQYITYNAIFDNENKVEFCDLDDSDIQFCIGQLNEYEKMRDELQYCILDDSELKDYSKIVLYNRVGELRMAIDSADDEDEKQLLRGELHAVKDISDKIKRSTQKKTKDCEFEDVPEEYYAD